MGGGALIRITDRTLSSLDQFDISGDDLRNFAQYLIEIGVDRIEVSEKAFEAMGKLPKEGKYVLRLKNAEDRGSYSRDFDRFVCKNAPQNMEDSLCTEIVMNDIHDPYTAARYHGYKYVRIRGLDDVMLGNYEGVFEQLQKSLFSGVIELCPTNRSFCATAIAVEWIASGGKDVVTSFGGIGGFAATEEVVIHLKLERTRKVGKDYPEFPKMRCMLEGMTGMKFLRSKPILGDHIFVVESGIHVDGILKQPKCYEPYPPEIVGQSRRFTLSKQSGAASIRVKLEEAGLSFPPKQIPKLLFAVKKKSFEVNRSISDAEFFGMAQEILTSV
jgi:homocitrate synthase NifV